MADTIREYLSKLKEASIAKKYKYQVEIVPPAFIRDSYDVSSGWLEFLGERCIECSLPDRSIMTSDQRYNGPVFRNPYNVLTASDFPMTFICSEDMYERDFFEFWISEIYDENYNLRYRDTFEAPLFKVAQLSAKNEPMYVVEFIEAWPVSISASTLSYSTPGEPVTFTVNFAFRDFIATAPGL